MRTKKATEYVGNNLSFCRLNQTPHIENIRHSPTSLWEIIQSVNPDRTSLLSGLPLLQQKSENYDCVQRRLYVKIVFYVDTMQRISVFSDYFYSDSTLSLTVLATKECMDIGATPQACGFFSVFLMFVITLVDGLCCTWFILVYPSLCWCWCPEIGTSSIDWA
jgi:hypothetical protein